ncbi:MAG: TolC family protein [Flavobacteriaceae bacterium]|nr:TolC family protein [Flavobacteriaceae bacterium]
MKVLISISFIFFSAIGFSQNDTIPDILYFNEYLGYVKKFHPIVKQANLIIDESQAKLMKSRGAFDPKIEVDYSQKNFKNTQYWEKINGTFKIPTWFGIELKAQIEDNSGNYLNPESFVPDDGLFNAGISIPLAQGLFINDRMASLKQAKIYRNQAEVDRNILVNTILYEASVAYFDWLQSFKEYNLYKDFISNAEFRLKGIEMGVSLGENAKISATEAKITVNDRKLNLEKSRIKLLKSRLKLSTFLWLGNNIPVEIKPNINPDTNIELIVNEVFKINNLEDDYLQIDAHPKILSLNFKKEQLEIDRRLKANKLLPKINLEYNFLTDTPNIANSYSFADYKGSVYVSFPLFLRKERGDLKLTDLKLQNINLEFETTQIKLRNKIKALSQEIESYKLQNSLTKEMVEGNTLLLKSEERKFQLGESSLFMVNTRENKLIDYHLKMIRLQNSFLETKAKLFNVLSINPDI